MNMLLRMAWRNIWRNRRRTVLLICAMTAGLVGVLFTTGMINGWLDEMVRSAVRTYDGHVKIFAAGYHENPVVDHSMAPVPGLAEKLGADPRVMAWAERIAVPALLSTPTHSTVVNMIGIDPEREALVSTAREAVREGSFLSGEEPNRILIGGRLARKFKLEIGKKVVLMSQQRGGDLGSGAFRVAGIFETGVGGFDEGNVYLLLADAQRLLGLGNRLTEIVLVLQRIEDSGPVAAALARTLSGADVEVMTWSQLAPLVAQYIELSNRFILPYYAIFYVAMAFGIVNAMSMAVGERTREIGILLAVGMQRPRIVALITVEALLIALVASAVGLLTGGTLVAYLGRRGIDLTNFAEAMDYLGVGNIVYPYLRAPGTALAVLAMAATTLVFAFIPAFRAARMVPVRALRTVQ